MRSTLFATAALLAACLFTVANCREVCDVMGEEKIVGNNLCKCEYPYIMGRRVRQLQWICRLNGCKAWSESVGTRVFYKPNEKMRIRGVRCQCVKGTDPMLMDAITLYHIKCPAI